MAGHDTLQHGGREPGPAGEVVGLADPTDLLPRRLDERLLVATHDLGAEPGGDAVGDGAVQLGEPAGR